MTAIVVAALGIFALSFDPGGPDVEEAPGEQAIPEPPELDLPSMFSLTELDERHEGEEISVTSDISSMFLGNCTLTLHRFIFPCSGDGYTLPFLILKLKS
ncbi:hypothetical protein E2P65_00505 [Candidatus Bathyarchaeota archaeon]|nr:hypothetical protein E2P65_00505 [Candidatus Bathyarchaeota archaeon]